MLCSNCEEEVKNKEEDSSSFPKFLLASFSVLSAIFAFVLVSRKYRSGQEVNAGRSVVKGSISTEKEKVSKKSPKKTKSVKKDANALSERQRKILILLRKHRDITVSDIIKNIKGVSERTLRRDMNKLEDLHFCKKKGSTKGSKYVLTE